MGETVKHLYFIENRPRTLKVLLRKLLNYYTSEKQHVIIHVVTLYLDTVDGKMTAESAVLEIKTALEKWDKEYYPLIDPAKNNRFVFFELENYVAYPEENPYEEIDAIVKKVKEIMLKKEEAKKSFLLDLLLFENDNLDFNRIMTSQLVASHYIYKDKLIKKKCLVYTNYADEEIPLKWSEIIGDFDDTIYSRGDLESRFFSAEFAQRAIELTEVKHDGNKE